MIFGYETQGDNGTLVEFQKGDTSYLLFDN